MQTTLFYSLLTPRSAVHDTSRYTSAQHTKTKKAVWTPAAPPALAAAAAAAAAADPVLAAFEWLRKDRAPGTVCTVRADCQNSVITIAENSVI